MQLLDRISAAMTRSGINPGIPSPNLEYDAADSQTKRKNGPTSIKSTDDMLSRHKKKRFASNALDIARNYSIAAWAVRKHLDFVSTFSFQAQTDDDTLNQDLEGLVKYASGRRQFDVRGMHNRQQFLRIAEAARTVVGDIFPVKFSSGKLQGIEADRVRDPDEKNKEANWIHGIRVSKAGRPQAYAIHKRTRSGQYEYERTVQASNVIPLGYYDRFDQTRGIGLITPAINPLRDTYENFDYALAKAKVSQLFALKFTTTNPDGIGNVTVASEGDTPEKNTYDVDFGKGPVKLDMDPGDDADFLESHQPSSEFQDFNTAMVAVSLKALDIPFSFYDESFTNFFGSRAALIHYLQSCGWKRDGLIEWLDSWTQWRLGIAVASGNLRLPSGRTLPDVLRQCTWIPAGVPWWRPLEEVKADELAVQGTFKTRGDVTMERYGRTYKDTLTILAREEQAREMAGVPLGESNNEPIQPVEDN